MLAALRTGSCHEFDDAADDPQASRAAGENDADREQLESGVIDRLHFPITDPEHGDDHHVDRVEEAPAGDHVAGHSGADDRGEHEQAAVDAGKGGG